MTRTLRWCTGEGIDVEIVPPEVGDGESFHIGVTRHGEGWHCRAQAYEGARMDAEDLAHRLAALRGNTGRNHLGPL